MAATTLLPERAQLRAAMLIMVYLDPRSFLRIARPGSSQIGAGLTSMLDEPNRLLDQDAVAGRLNCEVKTLEAWRCRGGGPSYTNVGTLVRYTHQAIEEWIKSRTRTSTSQPSHH